MANVLCLKSVPILSYRVFSWEKELSLLKDEQEFLSYNLKNSILKDLN